jgi:hypothetical protein
MYPKNGDYCVKIQPASGNHVQNGTMEAWTAGDSSAPDNWEYYESGATGSIAKESVKIHDNLYSAKLTSGTTAGNYNQIHQHLYSPLGIDYWKGRTVIAGCWVWCASASSAYITIGDNVTSTDSSYHTGNSTWQYLTVSKTLSGAATDFYILLTCGDDNTIAYFDQAVLVEGAFYVYGTYQALNVNGGIASYVGKTFIAGAWVLATEKDRLYLALQSNGTGGHTHYSGYHTGSGTWEWLTVAPYSVPADATTFTFYFLAGAGATNTAYMDGAVVVESSGEKSTNHLVNGTMETWSAGAAAAPDNWIYSWGGHIGSIARESTTIRNGTYSAAITCADTAGDYSQIYQLIQDPLGLPYWVGKTVTVGVWVWCAANGVAGIAIGDEVGSATTYNSVLSGWQWITATLTIAPAATYVLCSCILFRDAAVHVAYFDGAELVEHTNITSSYETWPTLEQSARVLNFGSFERTLQPWRDTVLESYTGKQIQNMDIELDNSDDYFAKMFPKEPFLGRPISVYAGFESESRAEHISLFSGIVTELSVLNTLTLSAEQGGTE